MYLSKKMFATTKIEPSICLFDVSSSDDIFCVKDYVSFLSFLSPHLVSQDLSGISLLLLESTSGYLIFRIAFIFFTIWYGIDCHKVWFIVIHLIAKRWNSWYVRYVQPDATFLLSNDCSSIVFLNNAFFHFRSTNNEQ